MESNIIKIDDINKMSFFDLDKNLAEIIRHPDLWGEINPEILRNIDPPDIVIHITGPRYNSSIGTGLMQQISKLQARLNRFYALAVYNDPNFRLSQEEKDALEIFVYVESGSSNLLLKCIKEFFKLVSRMEGWQKTTVILALIGAVSFSYIFTVRSNNQLEQYKAMQETAVISEFAELQKETNKLQMEMTKLSEALLSELAEVDGTVEINGEAVSRAQLLTSAKEKQDIVNKMKEPEKESYSKHIVGDYILEGIAMSLKTDNNMPKSISFQDILSGDTITYKPNYESISKTEEEFLASCVKGDIVKLEMVVFYNGNDVIENVHLLKWDGKELETDQNLFE